MHISIDHCILAPSGDLKVINKSEMHNIDHAKQWATETPQKIKKNEPVVKAETSDIRNAKMANANEFILGKQVGKLPCPEHGKKVAPPALTINS